MDVCDPPGHLQTDVLGYSNGKALGQMEPDIIAIQEIVKVVRKICHHYKVHFCETGTRA
eukprot:XP_001705525.1 Hypothetical protein GL50803_38052 [Giardia lamblia ATCC 50803]